ncbi:MAG: DUF1622 domain-containing protein [Methanosarcinales archaeon]|jgi:uncharacterized membrane protein|nr:DUF1622 domain-containing protein [Methanosarcinales archaeon]MRG76183.1 DUF1622 domain-containing protein [ANME-2 cluster archaeon]NOR59515.1 DUF1622 domain-containing protein [Methanosarcinales archaeon]
MFTEFIDLSSLIFAYIGAAMILYGGIIATIKTLNLEIRRMPVMGYHDIRRDFTHKIVFGLDFLIAGDILQTIIAPSQEEIILLGAIVGIRTILGYFLGKEVNEFD